MKNLRNIATAILAVIVFSTTAAAQAKTAPANEPLSVKYIGNEEGYILFQVEVNPLDKNFTLLKINDKADGEIYSQSYRKGAKLTTFKIEKKDTQELSFRLLSGKNVYTKTFYTTVSNVEATTVNENDDVVVSK
jgi:hypothetical protein